MANVLLNTPGEVVFEPAPYKELLLGCGRDRRKLLKPKDTDGSWCDLTTLDVNPKVDPDVLWDLNMLPLPFDAETFNEIHCYECLEHFGKQGDYVSFFAFFNEIYRILKTGGTFYASVPSWDSEWAWGDPGHVRVITPGSLLFLEQVNYGRENNPMTDYRDVYQGDFQVEGVQFQAERMYWVMHKK